MDTWVMQSQPSLPIPLALLTGRDQERKSASVLLPHLSCLLTLAGLGGVGKTRLALALAYELHGVFPHGIYFIPLAPIRDPVLGIPAIAEALGSPEQETTSYFELLSAFLRDRHLLLLLDSFELVVDAAPQLARLLSMCVGLTMLVTSRAALYVQRAQQFPALSLKLPNLMLDAELLSQNPAVALFLYCVRAIQTGFQLTAANARTIAEICIRLDGLPLAIGMAAMQRKLPPPHALLKRLLHGLLVLAKGKRDVPARRQTLLDSLQSSYDLLTRSEQQLFRRSAFEGGSTLETIELLFVARGENPVLVLDGVASLLDKNLLSLAESEQTSPRLSMLLLIRENGLELLLFSGKGENIRHVHAAYNLSLIRQAFVLFGEGHDTWRELLVQGQGNIRYALQWMQKCDGSIEHLLSVSWGVSLRECFLLNADAAGVLSMCITKSVEQFTQLTREDAEAPAPMLSPLAVHLTWREREVLHLLLLGLMNAQIAEQLVISTVTVNVYLRTIYRKLEVSNRIQAARSMIDHRLLPWLLLKKASNLSRKCFKGVILKTPTRRKVRENYASRRADIAAH